MAPHVLVATLEFEGAWRGIMASKGVRQDRALSRASPGAFAGGRTGFFEGLELLWFGAPFARSARARWVGRP